MLTARLDDIPLTVPTGAPAMIQPCLMKVPLGRLGICPRSGNCVGKFGS
jgi:hypothetical protein